MPYFTKEFISFFQELIQNNTREWFQENKKRYETHVKKTFKSFVKDLIAEIAKHENLILTPEEAIFRMNRDIRFSKDKTPYKTHCSAVIANGGRKNLQTAGFYLEFSAEHIWLGGGIYMPDKNQLFKIRQHIQYNGDDFDTLLKNKDFKSIYGNLKGEKNKIIPKEFKEDVAEQPLLANKQFYYMAEYKSDEATKILLKDDLMDFVLKHYETGKLMNDFLNEAVND